MTQTIQATLPASAVYVTGTVNGADVTWTNVSGEVWEAVAERASDDIYDVSMTIVTASGQSTTTAFTLYYGLLSLITDRTEEDAAAVSRLSEKGWSAMTDDERSAWTLGLKGAYNASDLNRVGNAVSYIAGRLTEAGYSAPVSPRIDWAEDDLPTLSEMKTYLDNVRTLRGVLTVYSWTPQVPADMDRLTHEEANDIEKILLIVDDLITKMIQSYWYSNEVYAGEV